VWRTRPDLIYRSGSASKVDRSRPLVQR